MILSFIQFSEIKNAAMTASMAIFPENGVKLGSKSDNWRGGEWTLDLGLSLNYAYAKNSVREGRSNY